MNFKLNIGTLSSTISEYKNLIDTLTNQIENINKTIHILTTNDWSGNLKKEFTEIHTQNQVELENFKNDLEYMVNALENEEKVQATQLKFRCDGFVDCIKRTDGATTYSNTDNGVIKLDGNTLLINNNVKNITRDYCKSISTMFDNVINLSNSLEYSSLGISDNVWNCKVSIANEIKSLTDFNDSFNIYCSKVNEMELNISSVLSKISGITDNSLISHNIILNPNGELNAQSINSLLLRNQDDLSQSEKEALEYVLNNYTAKELQDIFNSIDSTGPENSIYSILTNAYPELKGDNFSFGSNTFGLGLSLAELTTYGILEHKIAQAKAAAQAMAKTSGYAKSSVWLTEELSNLKMLYGSGKYGARIAGQFSFIASKTPLISAIIDGVNDFANHESGYKIVADMIVDVVEYSVIGPVATAVSEVVCGVIGGITGGPPGAAVGIGVGLLAAVGITSFVDGVNIVTDAEGNDLTIREAAQNSLEDSLEYGHKSFKGFLEYVFL